MTVNSLHIAKRKFPFFNKFVKLIKRKFLKVIKYFLNQHNYIKLIFNRQLLTTNYDIKFISFKFKLIMIWEHFKI